MVKCVFRYNMTTRWRDRWSWYTALHSARCACWLTV